MGRHARTRQPQFAAPLSAQFEQYISAANNWATPSPGWVGVSSPTFQATDDGLSVAGNASSSYATRPIPSTLTQPMWMLVYFVAPAPATTGLTYYAISAETGSTPNATALLRNGDGTNTNLNFLFRGTNAGGFNHKNGPVLTAGQLYCAVCVVPTGTTASTYMYVNGVKYNTAAATDANVTMGGASLVNESVDALKRNTVTGVSNYKILLTAHGIGADKLLSEAQARDLSINPWAIYAGRPSEVFSASAGTSGGSAALSTTTDNSTFSGSAQVSPIAAISTSTASSIFAGAAQVSPLAVLSTSTDPAVFSGASAVSPLSAIAVTTDASTFAGSAASGTGAAIVAVTADSVFSGAAQVSPIAAIAATTSDSAVAGAAFVSPLAGIATSTAPAVFSGAAESLSSASILVVTANSIFAGSAAGYVAPAQTLNQTDIDLIAEAVWAKAIGGTFTAEQMQRIMFSALAGKRAGIGSATETYYDVSDGITPRITLAPDANGNGVPIVSGG